MRTIVLLSGAGGEELVQVDLLAGGLSEVSRSLGEAVARLSGPGQRPWAGTAVFEDLSGVIHPAVNARE